MCKRRVGQMAVATPGDEGLTGDEAQAYGLRDGLQYKYWGGGGREEKHGRDGFTPPIRSQFLEPSTDPKFPKAAGKRSEGRSSAKGELR
ncbi:MAG TPA: hypothetical protein VK728_06930 [Candidatus Sulfotelmatobacter sp.]|nr:hypothetical protein [Candidatus Sulfotelmatobacter sp.]